MLIAWNTVLVFEGMQFLVTSLSSYNLFDDDNLLTMLTSQSEDISYTLVYVFEVVS